MWIVVDFVERSMVMNSISSQKGLSWSYTHLASGKRINTAKDDAAGMAIAKRMQSQETGLRSRPKVCISHFP